MVTNQNGDQQQHQPPVQKPAEVQQGAVPVVDGVDTREVELLRYFSNLPASRQKELIKEAGTTLLNFGKAVDAHKKAALEDVEKAIEKMKAEVMSNKASEKSRLLDKRYRIQIEKFAKAGIRASQIAEHLTQAELAASTGASKKPKDWSFSTGLVVQFMKDNGIEVAKEK